MNASVRLIYLTDAPTREDVRSFDEALKARRAQGNPRNVLWLIIDKAIGHGLSTVTEREFEFPQCGRVILVEAVPMPLANCCSRRTSRPSFKTESRHRAA
jgi:hypothetical protein